MTSSFIAALKGLRQSRRFLDKPVPPEIVTELLDVARWTGSAKNTQPWHLIVVDDPEVNRALGAAGQYTGFLDNVALSIVIVLDGTWERGEAYDEGRLSERLMLAADHFGLGSGTAWFGTGEAQATARALLGIPDDREVRSAVGFGYIDRAQPQRASAVGGGRKPLSDIVSYGRFGESNSRYRPE